MTEVKGNGPNKQGKGGVVTYANGHIQGVKSELVVHTNHSCQGNPQAIEEVRRIHYEHAGAHP